MNFEEYETRVIARTGVITGRDGKLLAALGLCGEAAEVLEIDVMTCEKELLLRELGDVLWYVGYCGRQYGLRLEEFARAAGFLRMPGAQEDLSICAGKIADLVKKEIFHEQAMDLDRLKALLRWCVVHLHQIAARRASTLEEVMSLSERKLLARFPAGWDPKAARAKADETG